VESKAGLANLKTYEGRQHHTGWNMKPLLKQNNQRKTTINASLGYHQRQTLHRDGTHGRTRADRTSVTTVFHSSFWQGIFHPSTSSIATVHPSLQLAVDVEIGSDINSKLS